jgi:hypothetical protein
VSIRARFLWATVDTIVERVVEQLRPKDSLDGLVNTGVDGPEQIAPRRPYRDTTQGLSCQQASYVPYGDTTHEPGEG